MGGMKGKVAVVTGASRGIGRAIASALSSQGADVVVHYGARADAAEGVVHDIATRGGRAVAFRADLSDPDAVRGFWPALEPLMNRAFGTARPDVLVNNAGLGGGMRTIDHIDETELDRMLQVNLKAPFFLIQQAIPRLNDGGRIVNISSMGVRSAYPGMAAYAPTKAGMEALTLLLAAQLGPRGITVNAVRPGATVTDMNPRARDPDQAAALAQTIALRRVGQPEDVAAVVAFLASEAGRWVTGQVLDASGGQRI